MVNSTLKHLSYKLFPGQCQLCLGPSARTTELCAPCQADLPWLEIACERCALPLAIPGLCGACLTQPPAFDHCHASWLYGFPLDTLISRFKYHGDQSMGVLISELALTSTPSQRPDALVPVPMHWRREWQRGYNQTDIIAAHWGRSLGIPVLNALKRRSATAAQRGLTASQRKRNLAKAFTLRSGAGIAGRHIAIVDDVLTTGATANTLAAILRRAGASRISIWCLARTP